MIVRVHSHRARQKLSSLLGSQPPGFFSYRRCGEFREVPDDRGEEALRIKGITKSRQYADLLPYINWS